MVKLTPTGVKINTNLVWTSHNTGGVEFNTGVFAVYSLLTLSLKVSMMHCTELVVKKKWNAKSKISHHCDGRNFFFQLSFLSSQRPRHFMYGISNPSLHSTKTPTKSSHNQTCYHSNTFNCATDGI